MNLLSFLTFASLLALAIDIVLQHKRIRKTRSSRDVSIWGAEVRLLAIVILLIKFWSMRDLGLFAGQSIILVVFLLYLVDVRKFDKRKK